jgi:hypothetical protein
VTLAAIGAALACVAQAQPAPTPLGPGDTVGTMTLARAAYRDGLLSIFAFCEPRTYAPAVYHRHCTVPRTHRLFVGYGDFEATYPALVRAWRRERWRLRVDGHEVRLADFGTDDRVLYDYPPGEGRNSILREWRVLLLDPTPGRHLIRYITRERGAVTDVTFVVNVR